MKTEILVIGSGPGGAVTACELAEAGRQVTILEEGGPIDAPAVPQFSPREMEQKYRNGGITVALGKTKISYVEGRCAGGGSEINAGFYHRTPTEILNRWQTEYQADGLALGILNPIFEQCEKDLLVSLLEEPAPAASLKLHQGAGALGWRSMEVPRWFHKGKRQSMSRTFLPRALQAGAKLLTGVRARSIRFSGGKWHVKLDGNAETIEAETLFIACGAVQTPALLLRSGIKHNIGSSLQLHPTIKVVAEFTDTVNSRDMGIPVHQVKEFSPRLSFGCSISSPPYLSVAMLDHPDHSAQVAEKWSKMAIYYAMIFPTGKGSVSNVPFFNDPKVSYRLSKDDLTNLSDGLKKLCQMLFESGAATLYPSIFRGPVLRKKDEMKQIYDSVPAARTSLMTIHLFSSCPMGENRRITATDSFGKVHGQKNLYIADASLLCTALGVNPQGTVMAIARRNARRFLGKL